MKKLIELTYCMAALVLLTGCADAAAKKKSATPESAAPAGSAAHQSEAAEPAPAKSEETAAAATTLATPKSWTGEKGCLSVDNKIFNSAPRSVKLTPKQGGFSYIASQRVKVQPGTEYLVSAYVRTQGNEEVNDFLPIRWFKGNEFIKQFGPVAPGDYPEWSLIEATAVAPAEATHADVAFFMQSQAGTIWIDDVSLKAVGDDTELLVNRSFDDK